MLLGQKMVTVSDRMIICALKSLAKITILALPCLKHEYFHMNAGSTACTDCERGKYSGVTASSGCSSCVAGKYSAASGATTSSTCSSCPSGSSSPSGSDSASHCTCISGLSGPNGGPCTSCVAGKYKSSSGPSSFLPNMLRQQCPARLCTRYLRCIAPR